MWSSFENENRKMNIIQEKENRGVGSKINIGVWVRKEDFWFEKEKRRFGPKIKKRHGLKRKTPGTR